jgi:hypothetical protein
MTDEHSGNRKKALRALERHGLLLNSDASFPSVATLVAGGPIRGSWWAHPASHDIYHVEVELKDRPDVVVVKLVSGKNTFVHRRLWPALLAVATARGAWQLNGLSPNAKALLDAVTRSGQLRTDQVPKLDGSRKDSPGEMARQLERRLLVHADEVHTDSGAHAKALETWERWARRVGARRGRVTAGQGRRQIEDVVTALNERFGAKGRLPWP